MFGRDPADLNAKSAPARKRKAAEKRGRFAEAFAVLLLRCKGYRILDRRAQTPAGEIDIIAYKGGVIVYIEVKYRQIRPGAKAGFADIAAVGETISTSQKRRIARAADWWMARHQQKNGLDQRFDAILIQGWRARHIQNAWAVQTFT